MIFPLDVNEHLAGWVILDCSSSLYLFENVVPRPLACRVSVEKSADTLREFLCVLLVTVPLLLLIFFLCLWFLLIWLLQVSTCFSLGLSCLGQSVLCGLEYFFSHVKDIFSYHILRYFLGSILSSPCECWCIQCCSRGLFLHSLFLILLHGSDFQHSVFQLTLSGLPPCLFWFDPL